MRGTRRLAAVLAVLLAALACAGAGAGPATAEERLDVVAFNVLAPVWAAPAWYPEELDPALLDAGVRRERIAAFLAARAATADVVCLQEVQESELPAFLAALGSGFTGAMAYNARDWWSDWVVPEIPWAPNGTAVIVRRAAFRSIAFRDVALTDDGNHAAAFSGVHRATGRLVRAVSVHLDSDSQANRGREARAAVAELPRTAVAAGAADVICGDINEDAVTGTAAGVFSRAGFTDALAAVGNREPTHPWSSSYNGAPRWGIIDHVLVRGAVPRDGDVADFGVWAIADEVERIAANLRNTGSDHFPVLAGAGL